MTVPVTMMSWGAIVMRSSATAWQLPRVIVTHKRDNVIASLQGDRQHSDKSTTAVKHGACYTPVRRAKFSTSRCEPFSATFLLNFADGIGPC
jgi:hypothetical protein